MPQQILQRSLLTVDHRPVPELPFDHVLRNNVMALQPPVRLA
jgi:hypothetical protein